MKFKFHKGYRGFYLLDDNKFKKPFSRLDQLLTEEKLKLDNKFIDFNKENIIEIEDKYVVLNNKENKKVVNNKSKDLLSIYTRLGNTIPVKVIDNIKLLIDNDNKDSYVFCSVFEIIENILYADNVLKTKSKKISSYNHKELENLIERYTPQKAVLLSLEKEIEQNYPSQYVYENLPLNYKEKEMIYVLYFIIIIELLSILK
ncbi:exonuclease SbcC [Gemella sp. GH3]|uniref:exonuclease SbcC n=1 Tax=unclassified Gemella TaxID=2624949 RepID=UPI0015D0C155|nr:MULTISPECIES: exonuclease SbcC [unclassified Gemella]MBF0713755.1 exonuclease SbcC [Gemella sp. GH3.1]NYS50707.1 exonuclease SbcC [Gemella sp. GH3]